MSLAASPELDLSRFRLVAGPRKRQRGPGLVRVRGPAGDVPAAQCVPARARAERRFLDLRRQCHFRARRGPGQLPADLVRVAQLSRPVSIPTGICATTTSRCGSTRSTPIRITWTRPSGSWTDTPGLAQPRGRREARLHGGWRPCFPPVRFGCRAGSHGEADPDEESRCLPEPLAVRGADHRRPEVDLRRTAPATCCICRPLPPSPGPWS